jgi:hypothetical protein
MKAFKYYDQETEALCESTPRAAAIRDFGLEIELEAHRLGWSTPEAERPTMFGIHAALDSHDVEWKWYEVLTVVLRAAMAHTDGDFAQSMRMLAKRAEMARTGGMPGTRFLTPVPPDRDVFQLQEGWRFHGLGVRFEAWTATDYGDGAVLDRARRGELYNYDARQESRFVYFYGRDGVLWTIHRRRSHIPTVCAEAPGAHHAGGPLPGLSRIVNSVASEDVPIIPSADEALRGHGVQVP